MAERTSVDLKYTTACIALVLLSVAVTWPLLERGVNDDWSYAYTARQLAAAGRLTYNGWGAFPVGIQAYWAALWIKLFGFSFTLVRLTTLPFAVGCAWLLYALYRRAGITPRLSLFGTLVVALSPVFLPQAASFMSDVPALFFTLAAGYGYARALASGADQNAASALGWLLLGSVMGALGGTIRQIVWLMPLLALPLFAWRRRQDRRTAAAALLLWLLSVAFALGVSRWFWSQPYCVQEDIGEDFRVFLGHLPISLEAAAILLFTLFLFLLPVLIGSFTPWSSLRRLTLPTGALAALAIIAGTLVSAHARRFAPWAGNTVTAYSSMPNLMMGDNPRILPRGFCLLLSLVCLGAAAIVLIEIIQERTVKALTGDAKARAVLQPFLLFAAVYIPVITIAAFEFDRYLLPVLPVTVAALLVMAQKQHGDRVHFAGWVTLGVFAVYSVASVHDQFAIGRAQTAAAAKIMAAGVARTRILAGFEFDAWTQLEAEGHMNNSHVRTPLNAFHSRPTPAPSVSYIAWIYGYTSAIHARYAVAASPLPNLHASEFSPVEYTTWLPPFRRKMYIQSVN